MSFWVPCGCHASLGVSACTTGGLCIGKIYQRVLHSALSRVCIFSITSLGCFTVCIGCVCHVKFYFTETITTKELATSWADIKYESPPDEDEMEEGMLISQECTNQCELARLLANGLSVSLTVSLGDLFLFAEQNIWLYCAWNVSFSMLISYL